jgi:alkanesulfonate monooxygenase SsuD/methylene tetrahydromethanopterin reductase-like flavin-dependent oxidoreductase (luciferase family)
VAVVAAGQRGGVLFIVRLYTGRHGPYPSVEEAEAYPYTPSELAIVRHAQGRTIAGAPEQVRARLLALAAEYGVDELVVVTITHDFKARLRSYELLAEAFGLAPPPPSTPDQPSEVTP